MKNLSKNFKAVCAKLLCLAMLLAFGVTGSLYATAPTLPDNGTDVVGLIGAAATALGTIVAAAIGVYFSFWVIKRGIRWMRA